MIPIMFDVRYEAGRKHQIDRTTAKDLLSHVNITALGIARHCRPSHPPRPQRIARDNLSQAGSREKPRLSEQRAALMGAFMSALGHLQTFSNGKRMSALPPKADISITHRHVRFGPIAEMSSAGYPHGTRLRHR